MDRIMDQLFGRADGPMYVRLIIQPLVAMAIAARAGLRDAQEGKSAYLAEVVKNSEGRRDLIRSGWKDFGTVFTMALIIDVVYQSVVLKAFYPVQAVFMAVVLAMFPYLLIRGPVTRLMKLLRRP